MPKGGARPGSGRPKKGEGKVGGTRPGAGRPKGDGSKATEYSDKVAEYIIQELTVPRTMGDICGDPGMPSIRNVSYWIIKHPDFGKRYHEAKIVQADGFVDEIITLADKKFTPEEIDNPKLAMAEVQRRRTQVDVRKWYASKVLPKKYGNSMPEELVKKISIVLNRED